MMTTSCIPEIIDNFAYFCFYEPNVDLFFTCTDAQTRVGKRIYFSFTVVWDACKAHSVRYVKGDKVSLGKYQQATFNARRTLHLFALKGFFWGIAARKLGLKALDTPKIRSASSVKAKPAEIVVGEPTLAQTRVEADALAANAVNQLDRAAQTYNCIENFHKACIATSVLTLTADWHSKQAKSLRSCAGNLSWELEQLNGGYNHHVRLTVKQITFPKIYANCGIEQTWKAMSVDMDSPRIAYANDRSQLLWSMCFASVREWEHRNLSYQAGIRRQTLLLDPRAAVRTGFVDSFKKDCENFQALEKLSEDWADPFQRRSMFKRPHLFFCCRCCRPHVASTG